MTLVLVVFFWTLKIAIVAGLLISAIVCFWKFISTRKRVEALLKGLLPLLGTFAAAWWCRCHF